MSTPKKEAPFGWFFYALAANIGLFISLQIEKVFTSRIWPDEALYGWFAKQIAINPLYFFSKELSYPPLMPLLISIGSIFSLSEAGYRLIVLALSIVGIMVVYKLGRNVSGLAGLVSAVFLSYEITYYLCSTFILIDPVLAVFFILLAAQLLAVNGDEINKNDYFVGLLCAAIFFLKWSSILCLIWVALYYLFGQKGVAVKQKIKKFSIPFCFSVLAASFLLCKNFFHIGRFFPSLTALEGKYFIFSSYGYFILIITSIPLQLGVFIMAGIGALIKHEHKLGVLLCTWFVPYFVIVSFVPEKDMRYILPILPCIALCFGIGVDWTFCLVLKVFRNNALRFLTIFGVLLCLGTGFFEIAGANHAYSIFHNSRYAGFKETGAWVRENTGDSIIIAGSDRAIRFYTDINYSALGGRLYKTPGEKAEFERIIREENNDIYLVIDTWEYTQPDWLFPLESEGWDYLPSLDFKLVETIHNKTRRGNEYPVAWIFLRPGS